jgi:sulfur-oxidizing protein SoxZ
MSEKPRIKIPSSAKKGEVVEIKTMVSHPMESGQRKDAAGAVIPRKILNKFVCKANGAEVFAADLFPAFAANPYLTFKLRVEATTKLEFAWTDDDGSVITADAEIKVA